MQQHPQQMQKQMQQQLLQQMTQMHQAAQQAAQRRHQEWQQQLAQMHQQQIQLQEARQQESERVVQLLQDLIERVEPVEPSPPTSCSVGRRAAASAKVASSIVNEVIASPSDRHVKRHKPSLSFGDVPTDSSDSAARMHDGNDVPPARLQSIGLSELSRVLASTDLVTILKISCVCARWEDLATRIVGELCDSFKAPSASLRGDWPVFSIAFPVPSRPSRRRLGFYTRLTALHHHKLLCAGNVQAWAVAASEGSDHSGLALLTKHNPMLRERSWGRKAATRANQKHAARAQLRARVFGCVEIVGRLFLSIATFGATGSLRCLLRIGAHRVSAAWRAAFAAISRDERLWRRTCAIHSPLVVGRARLTSKHWPDTDSSASDSDSESASDPVSDVEPLGRTWQQLYRQHARAILLSKDHAQHEVGDWDYANHAEEDFLRLEEQLPMAVPSSRGYMLGIEVRQSADVYSINRDYRGGRPVPGLSELESRTALHAWMDLESAEADGPATPLHGVDTPLCWEPAPRRVHRLAERIADDEYDPEVCARISLCLLRRSDEKLLYLVTDEEMNEENETAGTVNWDPEFWIGPAVVRLDVTLDLPREDDYCEFSLAINFRWGKVVAAQVDCHHIIKTVCDLIQLLESLVAAHLWC